MSKMTAHTRAIGARREVIATMINKLSEDGLWDSMKAKDVPDEIIKHVLTELDLGKDPTTVRREMGIKSQTCKEWQKISAAIKMGYRVNSTTYFHRLFSRSERMQEKLFAIIDKVLVQDVEVLKKLDGDDKPWMRTFAKEITPMIDAHNRLQQGIVKVGKDLGVFTDAAHDHKSQGTTIIVNSNITLKSPDQVVSDRAAKVIEAEIVGKKELPKP